MSHFPGGWKTKFKSLAGLVSDESLLPGSKMAFFSLGGELPGSKMAVFSLGGRTSWFRHGHLLSGWGASWFKDGHLLSESS